MDILTQGLRGEYDVIVSNPPYVPLSEAKSLHKRVREYEPELALFVPDNDPLIFYRRILGLASQNLKAEGKIYFEIHEDFSRDIISIVKSMGFQVQLFQDLSGKDRMLKISQG